MNSMMSEGMDMMTGAALVWILVIVVLVLVGAAAVKYLFFNERKD